MELRTNRRNFLRATAVAGAGIMITSDLMASESPNEKIAFAAIGIGGKGTSDSSDAGKSGDMVAVCDTNRGQLKGASERFPKAKQYTDYRKMFDEMGSSIDAFTVSTTDHMHAIIAATGMRMKKHCFCQKPLTRTISEARKLSEIAREMGVQTQMGNQGTADTQLRENAALIRAGLLGEITEIHIWSNRPIWPQGGDPGPAEPAPEYLEWDQWLGVAPKRPYAKGCYDPFKWRGWWDFGTGALGDMACHTVNMPYMALDIRDPLWVQATSSGHNRNSLPKWSIINFQFPANDWRPGFKFTWYDGGKKPPVELMEGILKEGEKPSASGCLIIGKKGRLLSRKDYGGDRALAGVTQDDVNTLLDEIDFERSPGHFAEFVRAIKTGKPAMSNFPNYAGPLTETILLGNLAVWGASKPDVMGQKVEWNASKMEITNNVEERDILESLVRPKYQNGYEQLV